MKAIAKINNSKRINPAIIFGILLIASLSAFWLLSLNSKNFKQPLMTYKVKRVIDGDSLEISFNGKPKNLGLLGINAPELKLRNSKKGNDAKQYLSSLVQKGDDVIIEFGKKKEGKFGRLLGYVYLQDGTFLNNEMLLHGHAEVMRMPNFSSNSYKYILIKIE